MNLCKCGCKQKCTKTYKRGHNLRDNPRPQNLGKYIEGMKLEKHPNWGGGKWGKGRRYVDGYLYVLRRDHPCATKQGYVCEHRLIMEEKIGRYLLPHEVVHHIDGNRLNNEPENLELCQNQADHNRHHSKRRDSKGRFVKEV